MNRWWTLIAAGLGLGVGLTGLAFALGWEEAFAPMLLVAAAVAVGLWGVFRATVRRTNPATPGSAASAVGTDPIRSPRGYSPTHVGNDASARPWENPSGLGQTGSAGPDTTLWGVPDGFDTAGFLAASKAHFVTLQDAWDRADVASLRAMMTDAMLAEIQTQLAERERSGAGANKTEVVLLEARLLGIEALENSYMASVEFSGLIREDPSSGPSPFREIWSITRPASSASGWVVAGVQALQ